MQVESRNTEGSISIAHVSVRGSHGYHDLAFRHKENNEWQHLWIAGAITLLETVLNLSKVRERLPKVSSSNLQGRQLLFSQIRIVLDLPQWLTGNSASCSEKRKQHLLFARPWKAEEVEDYLFNPKTWELTDHCHFPESFCFYFPPQPLWVLFALRIFHRQFATSLGHLWLPCTWLSVERRLFVAACK